uniref:Neurotransmitter-gated ion-channel ligand-binding domain-containing protein n=1 Tax=Arion vulgaris TaxID=1028688 RepID=A0A0B6Z3G4_9EUPU
MNCLYSLGGPLCWTFMFIFVCSVTAEMGQQDINQHRLYYDLFVASSYNKLIRPVINTSESLQINFSLALSAIINVDAKNQFIITNVWLQMYWYDYQLVWNASDYGGIDQIKVHHSNVWLPDIVLFNK